MNLALFAVGPSGWGDELLWGLGLTLRLGISAILIGTALGLFTALMELSGWRWLARLVEFLNAVLRSLPELLVIFLIYYGSTFALRFILRPLGVDGPIEVSGFWAGTIALAIIHAAYASEVFRGAFLAVPAGQVDAGRAYGMGRLLLLRRIKLPLAIRLALPGLTNLVMTTLKNTPLVSAIGLQDLIRAANEAGQNTKLYFQFYMASLVIYLGIAGIALVLQTRAEGGLFRHLRQSP